MGTLKTHVRHTYMKEQVDIVKKENVYKRSETAIAAVDTIMLGIQRQKYEDILLTVLQKEIKTKLKTISKLHANSQPP